MSLAPWMVESANKYLRAAEILYRTDYNLLHVASINAAIGLEILLKSFVARVTENEGKVNQNYAPNSEIIKAGHALLKAEDNAKARPDSHDLLTLFYAIPEPVRLAAGISRHEANVEFCRHLFTASRYEYESTAPKSFCDTSIAVLREMVPSVVAYYKQSGCTDCWIVSYPNV